VRGIILLAVAFASQWAHADFSGRVVKVQDGDTLTVLVDSAQVRVRLDSIDAPELAQPYGKRARQSLADLCAAKEALVAEHGKDRYGRIIGRVSCAGIPANAEQVRRGMAWVFVRYAPTGSPLYGLEHGARGRREGLWADARPTAPWEWRRLQSKQPGSG
jgi:endonuclease YncB( thermonuclease family)